MNKEKKIKTIGEFVRAKGQQKIENYAPIGNEPLLNCDNFFLGQKDNDLSWMFPLLLLLTTFGNTDTERLSKLEGKVEVIEKLLK